MQYRHLPSLIQLLTIRMLHVRGKRSEGHSQIWRDEQYPNRMPSLAPPDRFDHSLPQLYYLDYKPKEEEKLLILSHSVSPAVFDKIGSSARMLSTSTHTIPAMQSINGVSAASRGVRPCSWAQETSASPSIKMTAILTFFLWGLISLQDSSFFNDRVCRSYAPIARSFSRLQNHDRIS